MEALRCFSFVTKQASNELRACMRHQNANFEQRIIVFFGVHYTPASFKFCQGNNPFQAIIVENQQGTYTP